mmetsp:Transcript_69199/g.136838  ORF Transcript_69199/g.136838 Transcript_69199/m.136838 type:complete len:228 (-) Transcript_69199:99-782(-)
MRGMSCPGGTTRCVALIVSWLCFVHLPEAGAYVVRTDEDLVQDFSESMSASDLITSDLAQAQFEVQDLVSKRDSWRSLCNLKLKGSKEWRQCQGVLASESLEIARKTKDVALLQGRLNNLASPKLAALQVEHDSSDAADALSSHLDRAKFQLDELLEKQDRWRALCENAMQQRSVGAQRGFLVHKLSQSAIPDKQCLEVVQNIGGDIAAARKAIVSYEVALSGLQKR